MTSSSVIKHKFATMCQEKLYLGVKKLYEAEKMILLWKTNHD